MGMFDSYNNIPKNYTPDNLKYELYRQTKACKLMQLDKTKPYELYNAKGELEGYYFNYGETINLDFQIDGEITLESDCIILTKDGQEPNLSTEGFTSQRCYNISDLTSWTCIAVLPEGKYVWEKDAEFTYPESGEQSVYVSAEEYLKNKTAGFTLYNFRHEVIYNINLDASTNVVINIDAELSKKLVKGIYYCSLNIFDDKTNIVVFNDQDCKILVK